jgi:hypothetical protein
MPATGLTASNQQNVTGGKVCAVRFERPVRDLNLDGLHVLQVCVARYCVGMANENAPSVVLLLRALSL